MSAPWLRRHCNPPRVRISDPEHCRSTGIRLRARHAVATTSQPKGANRVTSFAPLKVMVTCIDLRLFPLLARERVTEDHQAIHGLAGLNLDIAAKRIHAQRGKLRIGLKDLIEIGAAGSQTAARVAVGQGDDGPVVLNGDGCVIGIVQTHMREDQQLIDDLVLTFLAGSCRRCRR